MVGDGDWVVWRRLAALEKSLMNLADLRSGPTLYSEFHGVHARAESWLVGDSITV